MTVITIHDVHDRCHVMVMTVWRQSYDSLMYTPSNKVLPHWVTKHGAKYAKVSVQEKQQMVQELKGKLRSQQDVFKRATTKNNAAVKAEGCQKWLWHPWLMVRFSILCDTTRISDLTPRPHFNRFIMFCSVVGGKHGRHPESWCHSSIGRVPGAPKYVGYRP